MRSGLPLAGAQRCFQFPAQAFSFLFQALDLFAQPLVFLLRSIELLFRNKFNALRWLVCGEPTNGFHPTLRYAKPHLLSSKIFERPISEAHQAGKQIRTKYASAAFPGDPASSRYRRYIKKAAEWAFAQRTALAALSTAI
jgi:hypothetical protein